MERFIPVKVINKEYAEKLLDGEIFMRPLYSFGLWNRQKSEELDNNFRGDMYEGTAEVCTDTGKHTFFDGLDPNFKKGIIQTAFVDESDVKYFKIYCMYCMEYDEATGNFKRPDEKIRAFGDTAVIIKDYNEFIERFGKKLFEKYAHVISLIDRVTYYDPMTAQMCNPIFNKMRAYAYQNELRMAWCELEHNVFAMGPNAKDVMRIVEDLSDVTLNIGDIRDIAVAIPIQDFLDIKLPQDIRLHFPMRQAGEEPSNFDQIVEWSREQMKEYRTIHARPIITLG